MLKSFFILVVGFFLLIGVSGGAFGLWWISTGNKAVTLENRFVAAKSNREILYDNMAKQVKEKFGVATMERETVTKIIDAAVAGRDGGSLFKTVSEQYPSIDQELFKEVMATIGGKRDEFTRSQQTLAQIKADHDNLRQHTPSSWVVGSRQPLEFTIVSSSSAKETMKTGVDNDTLIPASGK